MAYPTLPGTSSIDIAANVIIDVTARTVSEGCLSVICHPYNIFVTCAFVSAQGTLFNRANRLHMRQWLAEDQLIKVTMSADNIVWAISSKGKLFKLELLDPTSTMIGDLNRTLAREPMQVTSLDMTLASAKIYPTNIPELAGREVIDDMVCSSSELYILTSTGRIVTIPIPALAPSPESLSGLLPDKNIRLIAMEKNPPPARRANPLKALLTSKGQLLFQSEQTITAANLPSLPPGDPIKSIILQRRLDSLFYILLTKSGKLFKEGLNPAIPHQQLLNFVPLPLDALGLKSDEQIHTIKDQGHGFIILTDQGRLFGWDVLEHELSVPSLKCLSRKDAIFEVDLAGLRLKPGDKVMHVASSEYHITITTLSNEAYIVATKTRKIGSSEVRYWHKLL